MAVLVGLVGLVGAPLVMVMLTSPAAEALTTITVTNNSDALAGSLRAAFVTASATADDVEIDIPASVGPINVTSGQLSYTGTHALTLKGNGNTLTRTTVAARVIDSGSTGLLTVDDLTITGGTTAGGGGGIGANGAVTVTNSTISGNHAATGGGIFASGAVAVTNSTISNNTTSGDGGGIFVGGAVTVTNSIVSSNTATGGIAGGGGGGILALGMVTVTNTAITGNHATAVGNAGGFGGGIGIRSPFASGVTVTNSTISGNTASIEGGGIDAQGALTVTNSTISGNTSGRGGAIDNGGAVTVTNSTISGNTGTGTGGITASGPITVTTSTISGNTGGDGGGGGIGAGGTVTLVYATVVGNSATTGSNVRLEGGNESLTSFGSVVALPLGGGANCALNGNPSTSHGFNLEDDAAASCGFSTASGDPAPGTSSGLNGVVLANNGGSTLTLLPPSGSALIDAIPPAHCSDDGASTISPLVDQIGVTRPQGAGCEIGAKEDPVSAPSAATPTGGVAPTARFTG
jgi:hypothetical protein